jgi:hypothetical protein
MPPLPSDLFAGTPTIQRGMALVRHFGERDSDTIIMI